jgi:hypothetical protein
LNADIAAGPDGAVSKRQQRMRVENNELERRKKHNRDTPLHSSSKPGFTVMEVVVSVDPAENGHSKAVIHINPAGN